MNQLPQGVSGCNAEITKESTNTRRWPRFQVQLPVFITVETEGSKVSIPGLVSEVSRSGMAVYAGVNAQPGELIHADFRPSTKLRIVAVVRNRSGYFIGLEFLNTTTGNQETIHALGTTEAAGTNDILLAYIVQRHERYLHSKRLETGRAREHALKIRQLREEIEGLLRIAHLGE